MFWLIHLNSISLLENFIAPDNAENFRVNAMKTLALITKEYIVNRGRVNYDNVFKHLMGKICSEPMLIIREIANLLDALCQKDQNWERVSPALPILTKIIYFDDEKLLFSTCNALNGLAMIASGTCVPERNEYKPEFNLMQIIFDTGICNKLVQLCTSSSNDISIAALQIIGSLACGNQSQTQILIDCGLLPALKSLLSLPEDNTHKNVCWVLSNLNNGAQRKPVMESGLISQVVQLLCTSEMIDIKIEAVRALTNFTIKADLQQIQYIIDLNILEPFCELLKDERSVQVLKAISRILYYGKTLKTGENGENPYAHIIENCGGFET